MLLKAALRQRGFNHLTFLKVKYVPSCKTIFECPRPCLIMLCVGCDLPADMIKLAISSEGRAEESLQTLKRKHICIIASTK